MSVASVSSVDSETPVSQRLTPSQAKRTLDFSNVEDDPVTVIVVEEDPTMVAVEEIEVVVKKKPSKKKRSKRRTVNAFPMKSIKKIRPGSYLGTCVRDAGSIRLQLENVKKGGKEKTQRNKLLEIVANLLQWEDKIVKKYGMARNMVVGEKAIEKKETAMLVLEDVLQDIQLLLHEYQKKLKASPRRRSRSYNFRTFRSL